MTDLGFPGKMTEISLILPNRMTFSRWSDAGEILQGIQKSHQWWIGDWLAYGEQHFGATYVQAVTLTGNALETLRSAKWLCEVFRAERRRPELTWTHHKIVAALPAAEADELLELAVVKKMKTAELQAEVTRRKKAMPRLLLPVPEHNSCINFVENGNAPVDKPVGENPEIQSGPLNPAGDKNKFVEFWQRWVEVNFPGGEPSEYREIAEWWWDALAHYELVGERDRAA